MFTRSFKIVEPRRFEVYIEEVELREGEALIKIDYGAICKADLRYYLGKRDKRVLGLKYPMNLIHEAIGTVIKDPSGRFQRGDKVTLVPNIVSKEACLNCSTACNREDLQENFCPSAKFASSNYDGFSKDVVSFPTGNLVKIPKENYESTYAFCELTSVAIAAVRRVKIDENSIVGIWGDGLLGYILSLTLKALFNCKVYIVGKNPKKLERFPVDKRVLTEDYKEIKDSINIAFECVGGKASESAIDSIIDSIALGGNIVLTGVAEDNIKINTRKILEKGITICGTTRSNVKDFEKAVELLNKEEFRLAIRNLILSENRINDISNYYDIFERETNSRELGKHLLEFKL